jgi:hypothetical protein
MNIKDIYFLITLVIKAVVLLTSVALLLRLPVKPVLVRWAAFFAALLLLFYLMILFQAMTPPDYHIFWRAGRDIWSGVDPYSPARFAINPFLNPPTALPLFALFAVLPFEASFIVWTFLNLAICVALPVYCLRVLTAQERLGRTIGGPVVELAGFPRLEVVMLMAAFAVSDAFIRGLYAGQLGILTAFLLIAALDAQARGRPILAGACLALASIKVVTMLPFVLLFHRRADLAAWISLVCVGLGLCLSTGGPAQLPERLVWMRARVEALEAPGKVNDYSFEGTQNESLIGFDHLYYCLGFRNRGLIRGLQYLSVALLGLWVAHQVILGRRSRGAACSLVALFSMVFLYHRDYDSVILALPLVYCARRAHAESGTVGRLYTACAVGLFPILFMNLRILMYLTNESQRWGFPGRLLQATLLPYATWTILLVMAGLTLADSLVRRRNLATAPGGCVGLGHASSFGP